ncbi:hypothetical protein OG21DRAFT_1514713, partial [Imleria badia]
SSKMPILTCKCGVFGISVNPNSLTGVQVPHLSARVSLVQSPSTCWPEMGCINPAYRVCIISPLLNHPLCLRRLWQEGYCYNFAFI